MSKSDDFSREIPFALPRGPGQDPADRAPRRGATTGIGPDGKRVVLVPGEGVHEVPAEPPAAIPTQEPNVSDPEKGRPA
jgi:hypothetical protein